jgi:hypothetical protein
LVAGILLGLACAGTAVAQPTTDPPAAAAPASPSPPAAAAPASPSPPAAKPEAAAPGDTGLPEVLYGTASLPEPVRKMRERLLEAARTGDIDKMRPVLESNETPPVVSLGEQQSDAIAFWKEQSGDGEGREILAILMEILEAGYLHVDKGTPQEMYLWPYFAQYPLEKLTPEQLVELFKLITGSDFKEMKEYGAYIFFRLGIGPDGTWHFFVAGD